MGSLGVALTSGSEGVVVFSAAGFSGLVALGAGDRVDTGIAGLSPSSGEGSVVLDATRAGAGACISMSEYQYVRYLIVAR